jgi:hypothetical protein
MHMTKQRQECRQDFAVIFVLKCNKADCLQLRKTDTERLRISTLKLFSGNCVMWCDRVSLIFMAQSVFIKSFYRVVTIPENKYISCSGMPLGRIAFDHLLWPSLKDFIWNKRMTLLFEIKVPQGWLSIKQVFQKISKKISICVESMKILPQIKSYTH